MAKKSTIPDDPARLAQLQARVCALEAEVTELRRGLIVPPVPAVPPAAPPAAASTPVPNASPRPAPTQFVPNWDAQAPTFAAAGLRNELVSALRENGCVRFPLRLAMRQ